MFNRYRAEQFQRYTQAKDFFTRDPTVLIDLEQFFAAKIKELIEADWSAVCADYNEASYLYPFWQNYPPDDRGRAPVGDQYPWIEVGEHALGAKIRGWFASDFTVRDVGLPSGPDERFVLTSPQIDTLTKGFTRSAWLFVDIKSAGPRDDFDHAVMSHNQISGDGIWLDAQAGLKNTVLLATGSRTSHKFHCIVAPLYILSDLSVAPVVHIVLKPVYTMAPLDPSAGTAGQPLGRITVASIPNGILLVINPGYLTQHPGLLFPGKDDKGKNPLKVRARVSFPLLRQIAAWRVCDIYAPAVPQPTISSSH